MESQGKLTAEPCLAGMLVQASQIQDIPIPPVRWLIENLVPMEGIVLLYGRWGSFKTPLSYAFASAVATGSPLFGFGHGDGLRKRVLYIQNDTPSGIFLERAKKMAAVYDPKPGPGGGVDILLSYPGFDVLAGFADISKGEDRLFYKRAKTAHEANPYAMVVIDSLRTLHHLSDKDSEVSTQVYKALQKTFPGAVILLVHHNRKQQKEETDEMKAESFSGSQGWLNHATVAYKVDRSSKGDSTKAALKVTQTKSQAAEQIKEPLQLKVDDSIISLLNDEVSSAWGEKGKSQKALAEQLGVTERTIRRRLERAAAKAAQPQELPSLGGVQN